MADDRPAWYGSNSSAMIGAAAGAAVLLFVGVVIAVAGGRDDGRIVGSTSMPAITSSTATASTTAPSSSAPATTTIPGTAVSTFSSTASSTSSSTTTTTGAVPTTVVAGPAGPIAGEIGGRVVVKPTAPVRHACLDIVTVFPAAGGSALGQVLQLGTWRASTPSSPPTYPTCEADPTTDPVSVVVPSLIPARYQFCVTEQPGTAGCVLVDVAARPTTTTTRPPTTTPTTSTTTSTTTTSTTTTSTTTTSTTTTSSTSTTTVAPSAAFPVPIVVTDGELPGASPPTRLGDLPASVLAATTALPDPLPAGVVICRTTGGPAWITQLDGLYIVWEGVSQADAVSLNWGYTGASVNGSPQLVTSTGLTIGASRADVIAAYADAKDIGGEIEVLPPGAAIPLRFMLQGDTVTWIGRIDCGD